MKIHLIVAQRKCSYPGQYAPEVLDAIDSNTLHDNPDWLLEKLDNHRSYSDLERVEVLVVNIPDSAVDSVLRSTPPECDATVDKEAAHG